MTDRPTSVRSGEELPGEKISAFLTDQGLSLSGPLEIRQFPSGYSNLTYFLKSGNQEWVLRRPPFGAKIKSAHDMGREFRVISLLKPVFPKVPAPVAFCGNDSVIGSPFFIMERVSGLIIRHKAPQHFTVDTWKKLSKATVGQLASLHMLNIEENGLLELGKPDGYTRRQVEGWTKRYFNAKTDEIRSVEEVLEYISSNIPEDEEACMIHNDFKYDNIVLSPDDPSDIKAILDWEMATIGNPAMDLATTLAYWAEADDHPALRPFNLTWMEGNLDRQQVLELYHKKTGRSFDDMIFYFTYACFKLAVISQQIFARYKAGHTRDPRFAMLIEVVKACGEKALKAMKKGRVSKLNS